MIEKQNAVELKEAAGDAAEIDDVIDAGTRRFTEPGGRAKRLMRPGTAGGTKADASL